MFNIDQLTLNKKCLLVSNGIVTLILCFIQFFIFLSYHCINLISIHQEFCNKNFMLTQLPYDMKMLVVETKAY